jgi:glycosyltransferase involved in cell wall biosynthesis
VDVLTYSIVQDSDCFDYSNKWLSEVKQLRFLMTDIAAVLMEQSHKFSAISSARYIPWHRSLKVDISLFAHDTIRPFRPRHEDEFLIVRNAWYPKNVPRFVKLFRKTMGKPDDRVILLSNTEEIHQERLKNQFNSHFINIGCFIDDRIFRPDSQSASKIYDAVSVSRFSWHERDELKRHYLMSEIESLALLDPIYASNNTRLKKRYTQKENCKYYNCIRLPPEKVNRILQSSHCGLILSAHEGVCRASCEYLLAGLPVVSTPSVGGRDIWYDDYNSIVVEPAAEKVMEAVQHFKTHPRNPFIIRENFLKKAAMFRSRFITDVLQPILQPYCENVNGEKFLQEHPFQWWP